MTITPGDFRDAEGNIDRIAYEDARRGELDRIANERAAEAGERVAKSVEASDAYVRAEDHFRYGSSDPIRYEDVRSNIANTYNPADAMWTIDADGNGIVDGLSWQRPQAISYGRRAFGIGNEENYLTNMDGGALGSSPYKYDYQRDLEDESLVAGIDRSGGPEDDRQAGSGWLGLFEFLLPEQLGGVVGSSNKQRHMKFMTESAERAAAAGFSAEATYADWRKKNPLMAMKLEGRNGKDKYMNASSPQAMANMIMVDAQLEHVNESYEIFREDSSNLSWLTASALNTFSADVANIDTLRTTVLTLGGGTILKALSGATKVAKPMSRPIGFAGPMQNVSTAERASQAVSSIAGAAGDALTFAYRPGMGLGKYALGMGAEGFAYGVLDTDRRQRDAAKMAQVVGDEYDAYSLGQTVSGGIMAAAMAGALGVGISFGAPAGKKAGKTALRFMFDEDFADMRYARREIEGFLTEREFGLRDLDFEGDPMGLARRLVAEGTLADEDAGKLRALVKAHDEADARIALKDAPKTERLGMTAEAIAGEGADNLLRGEVNKVVRRLGALTEDVDVLGNLDNVNQFGTSMAEVYRLVTGMADADDLFKGKKISVAVQGRIIQDYLTKSAVLAGDSLEGVAAKAANLDGVVFRSLMEGTDGSKQKSFADIVKALDDADIDVKDAWLKNAKDRLGEISEGSSLSAKTYLDKDLKVFVKAADQYTQAVRSYEPSIAKAQKKVNEIRAQREVLLEDTRIPAAAKAELDATLVKRLDEAELEVRKLNDEMMSAAEGTVENVSLFGGQGLMRGSKVDFLIEYIGLHETYGAMIRRQGLGQNLSDPSAQRSLDSLAAARPDQESVRGAVTRMGIDPDSDEGKAVAEALSNSLRIDRLEGREVRAVANATGEDMRASLRTSLFGKLSRDDNRRVRGLTGFDKMMSLPVISFLGRQIDKFAYFATGSNEVFRSGIVNKGVKSAVEALGSMIGQGRTTNSHITGKAVRTMEHIHDEVTQDIADSISSLVQMKLLVASDDEFAKINRILSSYFSADKRGDLREALAAKGVQLTDDQFAAVRKAAKDYEALTTKYKDKAKSLGDESFADDGSDITYLGISIRRGKLTDEESALFSSGVGKAWQRRADDQNSLDPIALEAIRNERGELLIDVQRVAGQASNNIVLKDDALRLAVVRAIHRTIHEDDSAGGLFAKSGVDYATLKSIQTAASIEDLSDPRALAILRKYSDLSVDAQEGILRRINRTDLPSELQAKFVNNADVDSAYTRAGERYLLNLQNANTNRKVSMADLDPLAQAGARKPRALTQEIADELGLFENGILETDLGTQVINYQKQMFDIRAREAMRDMFGVEGMTFPQMIQLVGEEMENQIRISSSATGAKKADIESVQKSLDILLEKYSILEGRYIPGLDSDGIKGMGRFLTNLSLISTGAGFSRGAIVAEGGLTLVQSALQGPKAVTIMADMIKGAAGNRIFKGSKVDQRALNGMGLAIRRFLTNSPSDRFGLSLHAEGKLVTGTGGAMKRALGDAWSGMFSRDTDAGLGSRIVGSSDALAQVSVEAGFMRAVNDMLWSGQADLMKIKFHDMIFKTGKNGKSSARRLGEAVSSPEFQGKLKALEAKRASLSDDQYAKELRKIWSGPTRAAGMERFDWNDVRLLSEYGLLDVNRLDVLEKLYKALPAHEQTELFDVGLLRSALREAAGDDSAMAKVYDEVGERVSTFFDSTVKRNISEPGIWAKPSGSFANNEFGQMFFRLTGWARGWYENYMSRASTMKGHKFAALMGTYVFLEAVHQGTREYLDGNSPEAIWYEYEANPIRSSVGMALNVPFMGFGTGYVRDMITLIDDMIDGRPVRSRGLASKIPAFSVVEGIQKSFVRAMDGAADGEAEKSLDLMRRITPGMSSFYSELFFERIIGDSFGRREQADRRFRRTKKADLGKQMDPPAISSGDPAITPSTPKPEAPKPSPAPQAADVSADPVAALGAQKKAEAAPDGLFK